MFRQLLSLWNRDDLLRQAFKDTSEMLKIAKDFFCRAAAPLFVGQPADKDAIYATDRLINKYEIETRRKVLEHLSISPQQDTTAVLVLTTIAVDIERLGDYSKNFFELWELYGQSFGHAPVIDKLRTVNGNVERMFNLTIDSFESADADIAHQILETHIENSKICESVIAEMVVEEEASLGLTCNQRVLVALASRYLKRISAHLKNVASSVVNPFDRIGFKPDVDENSPEDIDD
ncbi:MAG TPA: hypothetical protein ENN07_08750 [candidate division Zixibacteria bacterium]|nr:hypothetical protein [candidate division Zixibacteria bacterium]